MGEPHEKNMGGKLLFWFSLQGGCEGSKVVIFLSLTWVSHMKRTLGAKFCFGLVCKVVWKVQKRVLFFHSMGWSHEQNTRNKLLFWFSLQSGCGSFFKNYSFHLYGLVT